MKKVLYRDGKSRSFPLFNPWLYSDVLLVFFVYYYPYDYRLGSPISETWEPQIHQYWLIGCLSIGGALVLYRLIQRLRPLFKIDGNILYVFDSGLHAGVNEIDKISSLEVDYGPSGRGSKICVKFKGGRSYEPDYFQNRVTPYAVRDFFESTGLNCRLLGSSNVDDCE